MKKKFIIGGLSIIIIITFIKFISPFRMIKLNPSDVGMIKVFDGHTGKFAEITDEEDITHIIGNLNSVVLKREKVSLFRMGHSLRVTIYLKDSTKARGWHEFIINTSDYVRKDPFFYKVIEGEIDEVYIQGLVDKAEME